MGSCIRRVYGQPYEITDYPAECRQTATTGAVILLDRCWTPTEGGASVSVKLYLSGCIVDDGRDIRPVHRLHARVTYCGHHLIARGPEIIGEIIRAVSHDDVRGLMDHVTPERHTDDPGMEAVYI